MKNLKVRAATESDVPELVRVINLAYRVEDFFIIGDRTNAEDVRARINAPNSGFLVIDSEEGNRLSAAVFVDVHENRGHFALLSVDPAFQGMGLSRLLIDAVEKHCISAGCEWLDIEVVNLREELPAYYRSLGFEPYDTAPFPKTEKLSRAAHLVLWTKPLSSGGQAR